MLSRILLLIGCYGIMMVSGNYLVPEGPNSPPRQPPNCKFILNSPQFAVLCRVADVTAKLDSTYNLPGYTANSVCNADCRCVMGAQGGSCGTPAVQPNNAALAYCICNYGPNPPLTQTECAGYLGTTITDLCPSDTPNIPSVGGFLSNACIHDCTCSHGYPFDGDHICGTNNGDPTNTRHYCLCNNGTNIATVSS